MALGATALLSSLLAVSPLPGLAANTVPGGPGERTLGPDNAYVWDFGSLPSGATEVITATVQPTSSCCWSRGVMAFGNLDAAGAPSNASEIVGGQSEDSFGGGPLNG